MTSGTMNKPPQVYAGVAEVAGVAGVAVEDIDPNRRTAVLVGALFLIATATFFVSNALITPILGSHNFLAAVAAHSQLMIAAGLIALIDGVAVVGIAAALYSILKLPHPALAFGYRGHEDCGTRRARLPSSCSARSCS
jgi:Domain of unknown function (DUF4386)